MKSRFIQRAWAGCFLLALLLNARAQGQPYYNQSTAYLKGNSVWPFIADGNGLDFNTSPPAIVATYNSAGAFTNEGFAAVSDPVTGQLLFYSDGERCWNSNNVVMQNGDSLLGNSLALSSGAGPIPGYTGGSTNQGVCIVPFIDQAGKYYLFSLNGPTNWSMGSAPTSYCLYYSVIDMALDGGLGGIVPGQKNIPLYSMNKLLSESMIAIPGNNCDIWLMVHDYIDPVFRAYHITRQGLDTNAVVSATGSQIQGTGGMGAYYIGSMAASPDRKYLAITSFNGGGLSPPGTIGALLCQFDPTTGVVSNALKYGNSTFNPFGAAFSPDNSKLYNTSNYDSFQIFQFDIGTFNAAAITATQQVAGTINGFNVPSNLKAYNGKIYDGSSGDFLNVINQPDLPGAASDFVGAVPTLPIGYNCLPNDVVFPLPPDTTSTKEDTAVCIRNGLYENISIPAPAGFYGYLWDDGSQGASRSITGPGRYWVLCKDSCHSVIDTIVVRSENVPLDLGPDTVLCNGATINWDISQPDSRYLWQDGSTRSRYTTRDSGTYWAQLATANCTVRDTVHIQTLNLEQDLGEDIVLCKGEKLSAPVRLYAHVPPGAAALWSNGSTDPVIAITDTGRYWLTVTGASCTGSDTLSVLETFCSCIAHIPNAFSPNGDGINDSFLPVMDPACPVEGYALHIYNRYGARVFSGYKPDRGWDGAYSNGQNAETGTYMFEISFTGGTQKKAYYQKGDLVLIR